MKTDYTQGTLEGHESMRVISIRQHFAAMAMQGLLVYYVEHGNYGNSIDFPMVAVIAVEQADALIAELNKGKEAANEITENN